MSTQTEVSLETKKQNAKTTREFHQGILDKLGISDAVFLPKVFYHVESEQNGKELNVGLFYSELTKGVDLYIEDCHRENLPRTEDRCLYKFRYNSSFHEEYPLASGQDHLPNKSRRYNVPVAELVLVAKNGKLVDVTRKVVQTKLDLPEEKGTLLSDATVSQLFLELSKRYQNM